MSLSLKNIRNNKGQGTIQLFVYLFFFLFIAIFLGVIVFFVSQMDNALDQNITVGNVNLQDINNKTFGQISDGLSSSADNLGVILLLGMSFLLVLNAYFFSSNNKLFIIADFFIIFFAFILSVYISQSYQTIATASSTLSVYTDTIPNTSKFILNLPYITSILGGLIMLVSYIKLRRDDNQGGDVLGY